VSVVVVVATIRPLPEFREEVLAAFRETVPAVHLEPGCILYALHEKDDRLVMIEQWESADALATHSKAEALQLLNPRLDGKLAERTDVQVLNPLPLGADELGRLRP
jgi:quinol monooxygenase YgiN